MQILDAQCAVFGDLDGDDMVGITDFLLLLGVWGPCPDPSPPFCFGNLDEDCNVGITDFLLLLANWTQGAVGAGGQSYTSTRILPRGSVFLVKKTRPSQSVRENVDGYGTFSPVPGLTIHSPTPPSSISPNVNSMP